MFGWLGQLLRVNLASGAITKEPLDPRAARSYLGGRGLGIYLCGSASPAAGAPPKAGSPIVLATGPLTGTLAPNGGRYTIIARTHPEGEIAAASISGRWGPELKFAGFDAVILEGMAAGPVYLWIKDGRAELRPAAHVAGKSVGETTDLLLAETHEKAAVSCIGPAGENGVGGSLVVSDYFSAAGGLGAGAAMGAKKLKAIVVRGTEGFRVADHEKFMNLAMELRSWMKTRPIAVRGSYRFRTVLMADSLAWDAPPTEFKPARTRGCFACATSFSSCSFDGNKGRLPLAAGSLSGELKEQLQEYRLFTDLGLDYVAIKAMLADLGKDAEHAGLARKYARRDVSELQSGADAVKSKSAKTCEPAMDRGACMAAGYAIVPSMAAGGGQDEAVSGLMAVLDSAGLCPFLAAGIGADVIAGLLAAATGIDFSQDEIVKAGQRISRLIRTA